jgi:hypothetical protein
MHRSRALRSIVAGLAVALIATGGVAEHRRITQEDLDYPGTIVIPDGHGKVDVRVVYQAQEDCWRIISARQGMPNPETDRPTDRHLYVTVAIEKTAQTCVPKHNELQTRLTIDDKPGAISLDVMFVDERGVYQRSQRHRIQRDCAAGGPYAVC